MKDRTPPPGLIDHFGPLPPYQQLQESLRAAAAAALREVDNGRGGGARGSFLHPLLGKLSVLVDAEKVTPSDYLSFEHQLAPTWEAWLEAKNGNDDNDRSQQLLNVADSKRPAPPLRALLQRRYERLLTTPATMNATGAGHHLRPHEGLGGGHADRSDDTHQDASSAAAHRSEKQGSFAGGGTQNRAASRLTLPPAPHVCLRRYFTRRMDREWKALEATKGFEWFRVDSFMPVNVQLAADARHLVDYRKDNWLNAVCFVVSCEEVAPYTVLLENFRGMGVDMYVGDRSGLKSVVLGDQD